MFLLALAALVVWVFVWFLVAIRVIRRDDIGVGGKVLWIVAILGSRSSASSSTSSGTLRDRGRRRSADRAPFAQPAR